MPVRVTTEISVPPGRKRLWSPSDTRAACQRIADRIEQRLGEDRGADGRGFGRYQTGQKKGQRITLEKTGAFKRIVVKRVRGGAGDVGSSAPHARYVQRRFPTAVAISRTDVDALVEEIADQTGDRL